MGLLLLFAGMQPETKRQVKVKIKEQEQIEELDEEIDFETEPIEPPEPIEIDFVPDNSMNIDSPLPPSPNVEVSPSPADIDTVATIKSPVVMRGIFGSRTGGARGAALRAYGGGGLTEGAVIRALRWLKKEQASDGSWPSTKPAMTALALLTFLAHGETPASEEFGPTVEKAIQFLVGAQNADGHFTGRDGHDYTQPIVAYALCEAFALTKVPMVKAAAEKAILPVLRGQNPSGGFDYNLTPSERDDTSYMGWCAQAIKAAKMAGIDAPGINDVSKMAIKGFQKNSDPYGGFGYTGPSAGHGLTGVGVLCMQLLGASKKSECTAGLAALEQATFEWLPDGGGGRMNKNYYWYYITQAKFHHGGSTWDTWNAKFSPVLVKNQTVIKDGIKDAKGKLKDIGWWDMPEQLSGHTGGNDAVMNTCLCALQLQVYYRYLPTFKPPQDEEEEVDFAQDDGDIEIEIDI